VNETQQLLATGTPEEKASAAAWLRDDAASLRTAAQKYRARGGVWYSSLADRVEQNAEYSAQLAEEFSK